MTPPLVYACGPYRSRFGIVGRIWNIIQAWFAGRAIAKAGGLPVVPHCSCALYDDLQSDDFWLAGTMQMMRGCQAVYLMPSWRRSEGSRAEYDEAERLGMPVFHDLGSLKSWLLYQQAPQACRDIWDAFGVGYPRKAK
jgi:hypothetical protein